jgi:transposase
MSKKIRRKHSDEFKQEAVRLATNSARPLAHVARELNISDGLLRTWINKHQAAHNRGMSVEALTQEQAELVRLRRENRRQQEEIEILKKAAAYFAKESV